MRSGTSRTDEPNVSAHAGFGKSVNQYLNAAVAFADAKATAFLAASLTVGAALLQFQNSSPAGSALRQVAVIFLSSAVAANAFAIVPRLGSARRGLVFWEDIRSYADHDDYLRAASSLTQRQVEAEYAAQNYFVAEIAQKKHLWVRRGIWLFLGGLLCTVVSYLVA